MANPTAFGKITRQQLLGRETFVINQPPQSSRGHGGDVPPDAVAVGQVPPLALQKPDEGRADIAQPDNAEIVGADSDVSFVAALYSPF